MIAFLIMLLLAAWSRLKSRASLEAENLAAKTEKRQRSNLACA
jgi:hypothetical protein